jgi:hypothetical protein
MQLLSAGGTNKDIAAQLNVAERTVKAHLSAIFSKLGVSGRLRLAVSVHGQPPVGDQALAGGTTIIDRIRGAAPSPTHGPAAGTARRAGGA